MPKDSRSAGRLGPEALALVAARFRALGEPSRLLILSHLLEGELSVQELADATGLTQTTTSRQLAVLRAERIVARRTEGKRALYRVADGTVAALCRIVCGGLEKRLTNDLRSVASTGHGREGLRLGNRPSRG
jgi:DNA-binding transcriptional ArsR family regulator